MPDGVCVKCKVVSVEITIRHAAYCHSCFLNGVEGKFRATLARDLITLSRSSNDPAPVALLAFSGGPSSR